MKLRTLTIGDPHGRSNWKKFTHNSEMEYDMWAISVRAGADVDAELWKDLPYYNYDRIIFIGDYVDSFTLSNVEILHNLKEIIELKKMLCDKVILLIGNHDVQYMLNGYWRAGYRAVMYHDLYDLFNKNFELFRMAHEETDQQGNRWLWTHAGVTNGWYNDYMLYSAKHVNSKYKRIFSEDPNTDMVSNVLNNAWLINNQEFHMIDSGSGGNELYGSCIWVRPEFLNVQNLKGYNQIVGHTHVDDVTLVRNDGCSIVYIDCLGRDKVLSLEL